MKNYTTYRAASTGSLPTLGYYYQFTQGKRLSAVPHRHDFYELAAVLRGEAEHVVDERPYRIGQGDFVFLSPANAHFFTAQSEDCDIFSLSITAERFESITAALEAEPEYGRCIIWPTGG